MFGIFLPTSSYACGSKTQKSCCKKELLSKDEKKDCCNNKDSKGKNKSCGGKCGNYNCTNTSITFSIIASNEIFFKNNSIAFSTQKPKFYLTETFISSGFSSVWLPPEIK